MSSSQETAGVSGNLRASNFTDDEFEESEASERGRGSVLISENEQEAVNDPDLVNISTTNKGKMKVFYMGYG